MTEEKASPSKSDFKAVKIDNAAWLPQIAEHIHAFCQKAHVDGIQPGNLQTYFAQVVQGFHGRDASEFWMVFDNEKPVAFACWQVNGLPHISKVYCFAVYSWVRDVWPAEMLTDEWIKFGDRWRARWWSDDFVEENVIRLVKAKMKKRGFEAVESGIKNVVFRRESNVT